MTTQTLKRKFAAFDIDGTLFRWQLYHELVLTLKDAKMFDAQTTQEIDENLRAWMSRKLPFREYEISITKAFTSNLPNISTETLDKAAAAIVKKSGHKVYKYTREYIAELKEEGYFLLAISGSHQEIVQPFAELYGFDACIGTIFERKDNTYTGNILRYVPPQKAKLIKEFALEHQLSFTDSIAVGDSGSDISMLEIVEKPLAFNPAHDLLEIAMTNGWKVVIERKNVAYELQKGQHGPYILAQADQL